MCVFCTELCGITYLFSRNTLRITKASQLESVDPKDKKSVGLGNDDGEFDFDLLKVEFAECNAFSSDASVNIDGLKEWLLKIA